MRAAHLATVGLFCLTAHLASAAAAAPGQSVVRPGSSSAAAAPAAATTAATRRLGEVQSGGADETAPRCADMAARGLCEHIPVDLCQLSCAGHRGQANNTSNGAGGGGTTTPITTSPGPGPPSPPSPPSPGPGDPLRLETYAASCAVLLELEGGCAHDLSVRDPAGVPAGTRVSDICPTDCSGHNSCAPTTVDISFLGVAEDSSGHGHIVQPSDNVCIGGDGATFGGDSHVSISVGPQYARGGAFYISLWLLKSTEHIVEPQFEITKWSLEMLFSHPPEAYGGDHVEIFLTREIWLDHFTVNVKLSLLNTFSAPLNLHRDQVPQWTHLTFAVLDGGVTIYADGEPLTVKHSASERNDLPSWRPRPTLSPYELEAVGVEVPDLLYEVLRHPEPIELDLMFDDWAGLPVKAQTPFRQQEGAEGAPWTEFNLYGSTGTLTWDGPDDLSLAFAMTWDEEALYFGMKVIDDYHNHGLNSGWQGDALRLAFTSSSRLPSDHIYVYNYALHDDGHLFIENERSPCTRHTSATDDCTQAMIGRFDDAHETRYELKFPAPSLGVDAFFTGYEFGFGLCATDVDEQDSPSENGGWAGWAPYSIEWGKNPEQTGLVRLLDQTFVEEQQSTSNETFRGVGMARNVFVGATEAFSYGLSGTIAMFQIYLGADIDPQTGPWCVYDSGRVLVQSGRMSNLIHSCRQLAMATCTSRAATNGPAFVLPESTVDVLALADSGSCQFDPWRGAAERGVVEVSESWQQIELHGSYTRPVIFCSLLTRTSTAQAVISIGNIRQGLNGRWSFELRAEVKQCHVADLPALQERTSYLVLEAGVSSQGRWQAGVIRISDKEWHRASFHTPFYDSNPVVLTQVQNYDRRLSLVTADMHLFPRPAVTAASTHFAMFMRLRGEGIMCPDGEFYAEYYSSLDLGGNPIAECEPAAPNWHWFTCCNNAPPVLARDSKDERPELFSARWSSRVRTNREDRWIFSSLASGGSRVLFDGTVVLDAWEVSGSTFSSEPVLVSPERYIDIVYEYRSASTEDDVALSSYATLSWTAQLQNNVNDTIGREYNGLFLDLAWLAVVNGTGAMQSEVFAASYIHSESDMMVKIPFAGQFDFAPDVFAGYFSSSDNSVANPRLIKSDSTVSLVAIEYDECEVRVVEGGYLLSWMAISSADDHAKVDVVPTLASDVAALLVIASELRLPGYLHWINGSDPCRGRWAGVECRSSDGQAPRVVVVDIHTVDLTGHDIPWQAIGQLEHLEELSLWVSAQALSLRPSPTN